MIIVIFVHDDNHQYHPSLLTVDVVLQDSYQKFLITELDTLPTTINSHKGLVNTHFGTNFGWNLMNIYVVIKYEIMSKVCHVYRINC